MRMLLAHEGQQSDAAGALDGRADLSLVSGAYACHPAGHDLAPVGDMKAQGLEVLVVYERDLVRAEAAELFPSMKSPWLQRYILLNKYLSFFV
jgi:hypothetical protein